jgi:broad specificity phosphatase PhoE
MTKIILTRHGHVEGINPERFRGRTELPLTELGRAQAKAVAARIAKAWNAAKVYTSPMGRCVETGREIAKACGIASEPTEALNDLDYGQWQWRTYDEVRAKWPELFAAWNAIPHLVRFPEGDSLQDLVARTANALRFVLEHHASKTETVVFVGHDSVNRALLLQLLDQSLSAYWRIAQEPCAINEIDIIDGRICVQRMNETHHLKCLFPNEVSKSRGDQ